jgi:molecular chaperone DnaK
MQASMKLGQAIYEASQAQGGGEGEGQPGAGPEAKKDDVIDADFQEVDEDKKKRA